jgi:exosortase/archaeosortase family protein
MSNTAGNFTLKTLAEERFLVPVKIVLVYVAWKVFHHFTTVNGTGLHLWWTGVCYRVGTWYAAATSTILSLFGMNTTAEGININLLTSNRQVWVEEHCLAIPAMVVFAGAVLFFRGSLKDKAWFIPVGIVGIVIINILRLIFVSLAWVYLTPVFFNLHHSFIYLVITYSFIFLMIRWWMKRQMAS